MIDSTAPITHARQGVQFRGLVLALVCFWAGFADAQEELQQETILIKGNQGLPRTLYIAPWKRVGAPLQSNALEGEVGEETQPLEPDLFQRELELQRQGYSVERLSAPQDTSNLTESTGTAR